MIKIGNWVIKKKEIKRVYLDNELMCISIDTDKEQDKYELYAYSRIGWLWLLFKLRLKLFII